jgi:hypothetical protein
MKLTSDTTVKQLLETHPETFSVFLAHGMCEDCRESPPPVPLSHFASKHCDGDVAGLIDELSRQIVA